MSPALYGILQVYAFPIIDLYWEQSISPVLAVNIQPNMYDIMLRLYHAGWSMPPSEGGRRPRKFMSEQFALLWLGQAPAAAEADHLSVKREAVRAIGWVYYDVVQSSCNSGTGNGDDTKAPTPAYNEAVERWTEKNTLELARELLNLQNWIDSQPN
jgi:hypothetical protein